MRLIAVALAASALGCVDLVPPSAGALPLGTWGGDGAGVIVTDSVTHVHIGCTLGDIPTRAVADSSGQFVLDGSYVLRAYPVMLGPRLPARFAGRVVGSALTVTVTVNDTTEGKVVSLGPVTVRLGVEPKLGPCPICRTPKH
ncbi:MAG: hypothetical protein FJ206_16345 [Gemmatimonadetes bacterium]|nr:hypothetical protein [Gemmatimonadota bacterium]